MGGVDLTRERLTLPDGDFIDLDWVSWVDGGTAGDQSPLVVVVHGLEGSSRSGYSKELYRALGRRGIAALGMNFRSCGGEINRSPTLYHSGETGDLSQLLSELRNRYPRRVIGAVGVSLGGNVLLKYMGERGEREGDVLRAAVAISVPFDLSAGADHVERGFSRVYRWSLLRRLKRKLRAKASMLDGRIDLSKALSSRTFREFDDAATAPLHGFDDAEDYYSKSSATGYLAGIRTETLLIQALDDPFLPPEALPEDIAAPNSRIECRITRRGGHIGFVEGPPWAPRFWAEQSAAEFLQNRLCGGVLGGPTGSHQST